MYTTFTKEQMRIYSLPLEPLDAAIKGNNWWRAAYSIHPNPSDRIHTADRMAKAVVTLYGDDASVYGSLVLTQVR